VYILQYPKFPEIPIEYEYSGSLFDCCFNYPAFEESVECKSSLMDQYDISSHLRFNHIDIICDGPVAQSLGVEQVDPDIMRQPPRSRDDPIITREFIIRVLTSCIPIVIGTLLVYIWGMHDDVVDRRDSTMVS
jgi:hypothetical protein